MKIKQRTFSGGYYLKRFEGEPVLEVLTSALPSAVTIPLKQGFGQEVPALVKRGDVVQAGQIIGRDDATVSSPIHASVNGTVDAVKRIEYFGEKIPVVVITPDGSSEWQSLEGHSDQWSDLPVSKIEELLYLSGVTSLGSCGIPTNYKSSIIAPSEVEHIIVHHAEADVFQDSLSILLKDDRLSHFVEGLRILKAIMQNAQLHVAFSFLLYEWLFQIADMFNDPETVSYYTLKPKYPQHLDGVLIPTILNKQIPYGYVPANIGVLTFTVQDVLHIYDAVIKGKPLIERLISLAGPGFEYRPYLLAKIGTPVRELIASRVRQDKELRFVLNSLTTGKTVEDLTAPVCRECRRIIALLEAREGEILSFTKPGITKDSYSNTFFSLLLSFLPFLPFNKSLTTNIHGERRGCISCGFCSSCCPVGLYPHLLHHYVRREKFDEPLVRFGIFNCIDCNLCTYVCPSKIPVAEILKEGKKQLVEEGFHPVEHVSFVDLKDIEEYRGLQ
jgi:Na(+)-translocating NADH:ubiquinone oxidoreductase A subunit